MVAKRVQSPLCDYYRCVMSFDSPWSFYDATLTPSESFLMWHFYRYNDLLSTVISPLRFSFDNFHCECVSVVSMSLTQSVSNYSGLIFLFFFFQIGTGISLDFRQTSNFFRFFLKCCIKYKICWDVLRAFYFFALNIWFDECDELK